jgi:RNA polymerase sigma-70 factor, ECF subfamily
MRLPPDVGKDDEATANSRPRRKRASLWRLFLPAGPSELAQLEDNELVAALKNGDRDALSVLIERYCAVVFRRARNILGDDGEAEDIVERVFSEIHSSIFQFDEKKGSFVGWLLLRTLHRSTSRREYLERRHVHQWVDLPEELPDAFLAGAGTPVQMSRPELSLLIREVLTQLPSRHRTAVELVYFEGLTLEEAATRVGETAPAVRHSLHEGMRELRSALTERGSAQPRSKRPKSLTVGARKETADGAS